MQQWKVWMPAVVIAGLLAVAAAFGLIFVDEIAHAMNEAQVDAARQELAELAAADSLSPLFRKVAAVTVPAVVEVNVTQWVSRPERPEIDRFFRRFFDGEPPNQMPDRSQPQQPQQRRYMQRGLGSGFVVDAENGYVLTNWHVVAGADKVEITLEDGRSFEAEWVRTDRKTDLAVVKIGADDLIEVPLGDSDAAQPGDLVLAIGSPRGLDRSVSLGIVSAKGRRTGLRTAPDSYQDFIQTDAAINRGNSGGPLVNMRGEVIGINSVISSMSGGNEGIGFSIPSNMIKPILRQLVETGEVRRGYLGVELQASPAVDEELAERLGLPDTRGALVTRVAEGGPAAAAGMESGDFITRVDGERIEDVDQLRNAVAALQPGETYTFEVYRDGKKVDVDVEIGLQPEDLTTAFGGEQVEQGQAEAARYGIEVADLTPELAEQFRISEDAKGVVVTQIDPMSDAASKGLRPGMLITRVQNKAVSNVREFRSIMEDQGGERGVLLRVTLPNGSTRFMVVSPME